MSTVGPIARRAASDASCSEVRRFCTLVQLVTRKGEKGLSAPSSEKT
jgi:hypothetical protein